MIRLALPSETRVLPLVLATMYAAIAISTLLTRQTAVDYLYYYLPTSEYLFDRGMPRAVSPSAIDAPFGYPPAEYLLLGATKIFGSCRIYAIKLIQCAKVAGVFWLAFRLATAMGAGILLPAALIAPSAIAFFNVYSTDINSIIGFLAVLLILNGHNSKSIGLWLLVAYGALSKYTFWPFLPPLYVMLWRSRGLGWASLVPLVAIALHLGSNFHYFGNPVFPVGARPDPALPVDVAHFLSAWSQRNSDWLLYVGSGFAAGGGVLALVPGLPGTWYAIAGLYMAAWVFGMQPDSASDTGRFLLPVSIGAACLANLHSIGKRYVIPLLLLTGFSYFAFFEMRRTTPVYYPLLAAFSLAVAFAAASRPFRLASYAIALTTCLVYSAARIYLKFDVSTDLGYSEYRYQIGEIESGARDGIVVTDFPRLPYDMRLDPNIILWWSNVYGSPPDRMAITGTFDCGGEPLKLAGSAKFFAVVRRMNFEHCRSVKSVEFP